EYPFLGARRLLVAPSSTDGGVPTVAIEGLLQRFRLHNPGVERRSGADRVDAALTPLVIGMHQQLDPVLRRSGVAKTDHVAKFPCRVDMKKREWRPGGIKGFA